MHSRCMWREFRLWVKYRCYWGDRMTIHGTGSGVFDWICSQKRLGLFEFGGAFLRELIAISINNTLQIL